MREILKGGAGPAPLRVALLVTAAALAWQWLIVTGYFGGHWSALFYAGDRFAQSPPVVAESSFVLHDSYGYDAQIYHAIAHDPLDLRGTDRFMDAPRVRYSRILVSALSYALGFGRLFWVDRAYRAIELLSLFLGVLCMATYAGDHGASAWFGAAFLALPGVFISLERELLDLPLCALIAAAIVWQGRVRHRLSWIALAAAGLVREMGLVAIAGFALAAARERKFREAIRWALAALPGLLWIAYVALFVPWRINLPLLLRWPILSILSAAVFPQPYPYGALSVALLHVLDLLALAGALGALAVGARVWMRGTGAAAGVGGALLLFGIAASSSAVMDYTDVYSFGRQGSPLLLTQLLAYPGTRDRYLLWPLMLILPRALVPGASMTWRALAHLMA